MIIREPTWQHMQLGKTKGLFEFAYYSHYFSVLMADWRKLVQTTFNRVSVTAG